MKAAAPVGGGTNIHNGDTYPSRSRCGDLVAYSP